MKTPMQSFIAFIVLASPAIARACSVCFGGDDDALTKAFNWSIFFLLAAPYTIAGTIAACMVIAYRRATAKREAQDRLERAGQLIWNQEESVR
jgi:hypothetical protein